LLERDVPALGHLVVSKAEYLGLVEPFLAVFDFFVAEIALPVHCDEVVDLAEALIKVLLGLDYLDPAHGILNGLGLIAYVIIVPIKPHRSWRLGILSVGFYGGFSSLFLEGQVWYFII
jgi:hypothetical protein